MTGGPFDGVVAKRIDLEYRSGDRTGMEKISEAVEAPSLLVAPYDAE